MTPIQQADTSTIDNLRHFLLVCLVLVAAVVAVYYQISDHDFINFDDDIYFDQYHVRQGFNAEGLKWAFSFSEKKSTYWHPLTWLSFMLSYTLFGSTPGMHHTISLIIHLANSLLLFVLLSRMTGATWKSAFVAALFALHPLNVESVAWVTQRPNILSTSFWMLTLLAYSYYAERPVIWRYLLVVLTFVLGLMAKPMLITLPFVLLLLDYWPLKRLGSPPSLKTLRLPIFEKLPLLAISMVSVFVTIRSIGSVISVEAVPLKLRVANALVSYVGYLWKMIWPHNLSVYYPYPSEIPVWKLTGAGCLLAGISYLMIWRLRRQPYLAVGWLWFLGTLVPVIGLVQVALQPAMADRYAYVSFIGLFLMAAWGIPALLSGWRNSRIGMAIFSILLLLLLMMTSWLQLHYWANSINLFKHALEVTSNNAIAHNNLGTALAKDNRVDDAIGHFRAALSIFPGYKKAYYNLGIALINSGSHSEAIHYLSEYLKLRPDDAKGYHRIGLAYAHQGNMSESSRYYHEALNVDHDFAEAYFGLGVNASSKGDVEEAIVHYSEALNIRDDYVDAHINIGNIFFRKGMYSQAIYHYQAVLRTEKNHVLALLNLCSTMLQMGKTQDALIFFQRAEALKPEDTSAQRMLMETREMLTRSKML